MAIFSAFVNIDLHKDEIGIQYFRNSWNTLATLL